MGKLLEKLQKKKTKMQKQIQKGREITEQQRAEKLRKRQRKIQNRKPGAVKAISEGLLNRSKVTEVMRKEYDRRKYEREIKRQKNLKP